VTHERGGATAGSTHVSQVQGITTLVILRFNTPYEQRKQQEIYLFSSSTMAFPSYRPLTQHDRKLGVLVMAAGAAYFTMAATLIGANEHPDDSKKAWLLIGPAWLLYFGGMLWLILNSRYKGQPWGQLLYCGGSASGTTIGVSQLFFDIEPLVILGLAMCASAIAITVVVCRDGLREYSDYYEREARRVDSIPVYAIGTPSDPAWHGLGRNAQQEGAVDMTSSLPDGHTGDPGSKV
jgi:hypothetical protein